MKKATIRQVRHDFGRVLQWVQEGEPVEITKRGRVVALLQPPRPAKRRKLKWPDFANRVNSYCGDFVLSDEEWEKLREEGERRP